MDNKLSKATLGRIPLYLSYVKSLPTSEVIISSTSMSKALGLGEVQVRKDLGQVAKSGKPKVGYKVTELIDSFESLLGFKEKTKAVIVGTGKLGRALMDYEGFAGFGVEIVAGFDAEVSTVKTIGKVKVYPMSDLNKVIKETDATIGIITVPKTEAQAVADKLVEAGIKAIWNFAQVKLNLPENVLLVQENLALSLAHLRTKIIKNDKK